MEDISTGQRYQDFYKVVCDDVRLDWTSLSSLLKREFNKYARSVDWNHPLTNDGKKKNYEILEIEIMKRKIGKGKKN